MHSGKQKIETEEIVKILHFLNIEMQIFKRFQDFQLAILTFEGFFRPIR